MNKVLLQFWEESERGWGIRPDGASIHINVDSYNKYLNSIYSKRSNEIPDEYDRVVGHTIKVEVNDDIYNIVISKCNLRLAQYELNNLIKLGDIIVFRVS